MSRCANGHENPDGAQVCVECGLPLDAPAAAEEEPQAGGSFWARQEARNAATAPPPPPAPEPARRRRRAGNADPTPAPAPEPVAAAPAAAAGAAPEVDAATRDDGMGNDGEIAPATSPPATGGGTDVGDRGGVIALVGAVLLVFGAFLPWAKASGSLFYVTKDGVDGNGVITLLIAVVIGLIVGLFMLRPAPNPIASGLVLVGGLVAAGISIYEMFEVDDFFGKLPRQISQGLDLNARIGVGLYLSLLASAIVVLGAVLALLRWRRSR